MDAEFIQARLRRGTAERLRQYAQTLRGQAGICTVAVAGVKGGVVSLNTAVDTLLERAERNRLRSKKSRKK